MMLIGNNRHFEKESPRRLAKNIYVFCEGKKREFDYFEFFKIKDSRINVEVYELSGEEDNSPLGILKIAETSIIPTTENPNPKYTFQKNDEVWLVLDIDKDKTESRKPQFEEIKKVCNDRKDWFLVQSNPCFEVWLYYHCFREKPSFEGNAYCKPWKFFVNSRIKGGFDSRKHPRLIKQAIINSRHNYTGGELNIGSTNVYLLGESLYAILKEKDNTI
ncbi:MAG: RloB family protein [Chitinophagales bacterium]